MWQGASVDPSSTLVAAMTLRLSVVRASSKAVDFDLGFVGVHVVAGNPSADHVVGGVHVFCVGSVVRIHGFDLYFVGFRRTRNEEEW